MKNPSTIFIAGLLTGIALSIFVVIAVLHKQMIEVHESKLGFNETIQAVEKMATENKWSIPHVYDLQATMKKNGFDVAPVKVFSLCKPEHAYQILSGDKERQASALMPCRIAVYERDGKTYISMINSGFLSKVMGKKIKAVMGAAATENKLILAPIIK